jgi:hypothetical protein
MHVHGVNADGQQLNCAEIYAYEEGDDIDNVNNEAQGMDLASYIIDDDKIRFLSAGRKDKGRLSKT